MAKLLDARVVGRQSGPDRRYIGRPDIFGNPFAIGRDGTRAEVITKYAGWASTQPHIVAALPELAGKNHVCWCEPLPCHGKVLLEMVRRYFCDKV
ncbi:DUF4326 domain-containing protein [Rhizobium sp. ZK1]|uniref:DUF4326 domain-containing protein n=1 Tax=Rhizobium sp. ZK1 TaxID=3389872 RepID=UPI0039F6FCD2